MTSSLYIHIPFCTTKCSYCSFNSYAGLEGLRGRYVEALLVEMTNTASGAFVEPLRTVFMGGGTPSVLSTRLLEKIVSRVCVLFSVAHDAEISMEMNPGTANMEKLERLGQAGINRISFGVQSFTDSELRQIGRIHSAEEAMAAVTMAGEAGYDNVSLDLMYGLPGQTASTWKHSLQTAISLGVKHLSLYQLTLEERTPLERMVTQRKIQLPDEDELAAMDEITQQLVCTGGLRQYEISNYSKSGYRCGHNTAYWENREYFGFGAGAVSYEQGCRRRNVADPVQYCECIEAGKTVVIEEETLDPESSFRETVIMGLRMNRGISVPALIQRYSLEPTEYYGKTLQKLMADDLLEQKDDFLLLTSRGRVFANLVMAELV